MQQSDSTTNAAEKMGGRSAYGLLGLLTALNLLNFVDRQLLASFSNFIVPELGLTDTQFGLLTGFVFIVFYALMGLIAGALADRLHRPRLIAGGVALWSALTAVSGAARGFVSLAIPRMFIGVGESVLTPASMSLLADRFPSERLGLAAGIYYMGVPVGVGASLIIAGVFGPTIGWRSCFYLLGAVGLALAAMMFFVPDTRQRVAAAQPTAALNPGAIFKVVITSLKKYPSLRYTMAGGVAVHFLLGAAVFDQLWYVQERGYDRAFIATTVGWIATFCGIAGNIFGGVASDYFQRRTGQGRPMFLFWLILVLLPLTIAYRVAPADSVIFWLGVGVGYFKVGAFYGPTFSTVQQLSPPDARASLVAFYILCLNLIGLGIGVTGAGFAIDLLRGAGVVQPYTWALMSFTLISAVSMPLFLIAGLRFKDDYKRVTGE